MSARYGFLASRALGVFVGRLLGAVISNLWFVWLPLALVIYMTGTSFWDGFAKFVGTLLLLAMLRIPTLLGRAFTIEG